MCECEELSEYTDSTHTEVGDLIFSNKLYYYLLTPPKKKKKKIKKKKDLRQYISDVSLVFLVMKQFAMEGKRQGYDWC